MMFQRQPLTVAIICATLGLAACNSNDDNAPSSSATSSTPTTTVTVTPSLGKILSGRVVLRDAKTGVDLAPAKTLTPADNGTASFTVPIAKLAEPVIAAVLPTVAGTLEYADEALEKNTTITVPITDINKAVLRAATMVTANANIGVTPVTEAAVQQAEKAVGGLLVAQNITQANAAVKSELKLDFAITQAPIVVGKGEFYKLVDTALNIQSRAYAAYLTTLAKESLRINSASLTPAYDMAKVFATDLSDGAFDAKQGTTALSFYNSSFVNAWVNWVQNFYNSFAQLTNIVAFNQWYGGFDVTNKDSVKTLVPATPLRTVEGVEEYSCSGEGRIASSAGASIHIDFVNQRGSVIGINWLNSNGSRVSYNPNLATGQTHNQQTYVTHPWLVTDNTGACIGIYRPITQSNKTITFKASEVVISAPVPNNTVTCASQNLPSAPFSNLTEFEGSYAVDLNSTNKTFILANTSTTPTISLNSQTKTLSEVCGPTVLSNGTSYLGLFAGGQVNFFKDKSLPVKYSTEGLDFTGSNGTYYGEKANAPTTNNCSSTGADDILGFTTAPTDFCTFNKASSVAITAPDIYTFFNADKTANTKVTVSNGAVTQVEVKNIKYSFACGIGGTTPLCTGVTMQSGSTYTQFGFNNTALGVVSGTTTGITVKNGLLIHLNAATGTALAASGTASGTISNVQYNKDGTTTGGTGALIAASYEFSGDLNTQYILKISDASKNLRYELANRNGQFTAVSLYSSANTASPLFIYLCDTTGDNSCLANVSFTQGTTPTLVFNNMKLRGVFQPLFDIIINGQVKLNP